MVGQRSFCPITVCSVLRASAGHSQQASTRQQSDTDMCKYNFSFNHAVKRTQNMYNKYVQPIILISSSSPPLRTANNLSTQKGRSLVGKVLDISHDDTGGLGSQSLLGALLAVPLEDGLHAVVAVGAELDDAPALEAKVGP